MVNRYLTIHAMQKGGEKRDIVGFIAAKIVMMMWWTTTLIAKKRLL